ncbi:MAG TPA: arginine--tRNA ligase, partial [Myxococcota bacterium]|nr:arginine--tRNA ligase [Myxococcota bacterium]
AIVEKSVAGPGFINLKLSDAWLYEQAARQAHDPAFGTSPTGAGKTVVIDFSSPNVAKRMHIGHMRSTHIGHALCGLHRAAGWTVVGDNHIGDWGTQFGKLIVAYHLWLDRAAYAEDPIGELERIYVQFGNEVAVDDATPPEKRAEAAALMDRARAETLKLQRGDAENTALWKEFLQVSLAEFEQVYQRMGVRFDVVLGESAYAGQMDEMVERLVQSGLAEESQGALIIRFTEPELKDHPMIVRKKDGAANYATTDLACIRYRQDRWNPAKILYVTDMRQQLHFQQLFAVARRWELRPELIHAWFGMLVLPEGAMSTRKGNVIRLVDLLDEAVRRARAVVDQKSPELPEEDRAKIAEAVGVSAVRYADLSQHPQTNVTFDWDRMLSLEGNTAPYLLYSHARGASLLARAGHPPDLGALRTKHPLERTLLLTAMRTPEAVQAALRSVRPN